MNPSHWALLAASVTLTASTWAATPTPQSHPAMNSAAPLQISAIDHVGINVPDIDEATRFFSALTGARVISDISPGKIPDQWKSQFRWHRSSELQRFVMLQMDGGAKLELFQYQGSEINQVQPHGDDSSGICRWHACLANRSLCWPDKWHLDEPQRKYCAFQAMGREDDA